MECKSKLIDLNCSLEKSIIQKNLQQTKDILSHRWRINIISQRWNVKWIKTERALRSSTSKLFQTNVRAWSKDQTNIANRITPDSTAAQIVVRSKRFSNSGRNNSLTSTIVLSNSSKAMLSSWSLSFIIAKTRMRKSVSNFVTSKMILLESERLVYKNVYPLRRWGDRGYAISHG